eukprot:GHVS01091035.1.p1 GENE.GHVS01091035.1~~GHVS01091035.1.p1  ORF type:complete len:949 (+),score=224.62 GHVS01091035.1:267-3113(+)
MMSPPQSLPPPHLAQPKRPPFFSVSCQQQQHNMASRPSKDDTKHEQQHQQILLEAAGQQRRVVQSPLLNNHGTTKDATTNYDIKINKTNATPHHQHCRQLPPTATPSRASCFTTNTTSSPSCCSSMLPLHSDVSYFSDASTTLSASYRNSPDISPQSDKSDDSNDQNLEEGWETRLMDFKLVEAEGGEVEDNMGEEERTGGEGSASDTRCRGDDIGGFILDKQVLEQCERIGLRRCVEDIKSATSSSYANNRGRSSSVQDTNTTTAGVVVGRVVVAPPRAIGVVNRGLTACTNSSNTATTRSSNTTNMFVGGGKHGGCGGVVFSVTGKRVNRYIPNNNEIVVGSPGYVRMDDGLVESPPSLVVALPPTEFLTQRRPLTCGGVISSTTTATPSSNTATVDHRTIKIGSSSSSSFFSSAAAPQIDDIPNAPFLNSSASQKADKVVRVWMVNHWGYEQPGSVRYQMALSGLLRSLKPVKFNRVYVGKEPHAAELGSALAQAFGCRCRSAEILTERGARRDLLTEKCKFFFSAFERLHFSNNNEDTKLLEEDMLCRMGAEQLGDEFGLVEKVCESGGGGGRRARSGVRRKNKNKNRKERRNRAAAGVMDDGCIGDSKGGGGCLSSGSRDVHARSSGGVTEGVDKSGGGGSGGRRSCKNNIGGFIPFLGAKRRLKSFLKRRTASLVEEVTRGQINKTRTADGGMTTTSTTTTGSDPNCGDAGSGGNDGSYKETNVENCHVLLVSNGRCIREMIYASIGRALNNRIKDGAVSIVSLRSKTVTTAQKLRYARFFRRAQPKGMLIGTSDDGSTTGMRKVKCGGGCGRDRPMRPESRENSLTWCYLDVYNDEDYYIQLGFGDKNNNRSGSGCTRVEGGDGGSGIEGGVGLEDSSGRSNAMYGCSTNSNTPNAIYGSSSSSPHGMYGGNGSCFLFCFYNANLLCLLLGVWVFWGSLCF